MVASTISLILIITIILIFRQFYSKYTQLSKRLESLEKELSKMPNGVQISESENNSTSGNKELAKILDSIREINLVNQNQQKQIDYLYSLFNGKKNDITQTKTSFHKDYSNQPFDGIFSELNQEHNGNSHDLGVIEITGNRGNGGSYSSLIDYYHEIDTCYYSTDDSNSYICFDFKDHCVTLNAYTMKASNNEHPSFIMSWVLEGSMNINNDYWTVIDMHENDQSLCQPNKIRTFLIMKTKNPNQQFKYIRLRILGPNTKNQKILEIAHIELFGTYLQII